MMNTSIDQQLGDSEREIRETFASIRETTHSKGHKWAVVFLGESRNRASCAQRVPLIVLTRNIDECDHLVKSRTSNNGTDTTTTFFTSWLPEPPAGDRPHPGAKVFVYGCSNLKPEDIDRAII
jgi:hypothetical protein